MKRQPHYFEYFTQGESPYFKWELLNDVDMSWIDDLNERREKDKAERIREDIASGFDPSSTFSSDEVVASKEFGDIYFPLSHEWSDEFRRKYDQIIAEGKEKIHAIIQAAEEVVEIDDLTIYLDCCDGHHHFSTRFFAHGDITIAVLPSDSQFDSAETAVYAFINDWKAWDKKHGKEYKKLCLLSELDALKNNPGAESVSGCEHEDLGSLGYTHGSIVKCPFCGEMAEVW